MADQNKKNNKTMGCIYTIAAIVIFIVLVNVLDNKPKVKKNTAANNRSSQYQIEFGDDFKKGLASQDDLGLSVVIAIDCSGSMKDAPKDGSAPKYQIASESMTEIVGFLENFYKKAVKKENLQLKVGLLRFSENVEVLYNLTNMDDQTFAELKQIVSDVDNFQPLSTTAIGKTLEKGTEELMQSGTIFKSLIIVTDGENTTGVAPEKVMDAIVESKNNKNTPDFPVSTSSILVSFVGFDVNSSVFSRFHDLGARVTSAANKAELNTSLKNIFMADITKLESK